MDLIATCCCGEKVSANVGSCHRCAMAKCSIGWCEVNDAPAEGTEW